LLIGLLVSSGIEPLSAQGRTPQVPPNPPADPSTLPPAEDVTTAFIMREEGVSREEARARVDRQGEIARFLQESGLTGREDFVDLAVRHKPYQIILTFERDVPVNEIVGTVPQELRSFVKVRKAKAPKADRLNGLQVLRSAFRAAAGRFALGYDATDELFFVDTDSQATTTALTPLVPEALRDTVRFNTGALPIANASTTATPTGVQPGDWAVAGWHTETVNATRIYCTLGFPITFGNGLQGILTAAHCTEPKRVPRQTHAYVFPDVYYENPTGNYDYAIYRTDGLTTDYQIYYNNPQGTQGYASSDWLSTKNFLRLGSTWMGMYTCKSGALSGVTCGKVISKIYDYGRSGAFFLRLSSSTILGQEGDSGGPAFVTMDTSRPREVTAVGLHIAGGYTSEFGYTSVVMPIDRIFDHVSNVRLKTMP